MRSLRLVWPWAVTVACFAGPGCDDTRPIVDDPVGGEGNAGGEPAASAGTGDPGTAGSGAAAGQGGAGPAPECPADLFSAEGEDCSEFAEGFTCSDGGTDPCQFGNSIHCMNGVWERQEAFPAPCGGAGGVGTGGASGDPGGAGGQGGAG